VNDLLGDFIVNFRVFNENLAILGRSLRAVVHKLSATERSFIFISLIE
jgi:hypothetical protein